MPRRARRLVALAAAALALAAAAASAAALAAAPPPAIRAPGAILIDASSGAVLYAKNADTHRLIASTTKLMTAELVLKRLRLDARIAAVPYRGAAAESTLGLEGGERMAVRDLLRALLLPSANDAAITLARGVAGSPQAFVAQMNAEAQRLHLTETHFANPIGLDDRDNYSSPHDLAMLARRLLRDPRFASVVDLPRATLTTGAHPRTVLNRNDLVRSYPFVDGVKTGHTNAAGYCLVGAARRGGTQVISVVLGEPSEAARNSESLALLRYGLDQFKTVHPLKRTKTLALVPVNWFSGVHIRLRPDRDVSLSVPRDAHVRLYVKLPFPVHLSGPMRPGTRVGSVTVIVNDKRVKRAGLVTVEPVPEASILRKGAIYAGSTRWQVAFGVLGIAGLALFRIGGPLLTRMRGRRER